jgi:tRNA dimethylallyltransferase
MSERAAALPRLVVIVGPTASGKSALGIALAQRFGGEILACDSTQVYRHFDIGTGKVPVAERRGIVHHLIDLVEPDEVFTAGDFRRRALEVLEDLRQRGKLPIITAGTGLYLRALLEGLADAPERSEELRERLRRRAAKNDPLYLHRILARIDKEAAARIAPRDAQKVIRAIEIRKLAKKSVGEVHRSGRDALAGYEIQKIGLQPAREALYTRIHARVESMIAAGWPDEVRALIDRGIPANAKPFQFIGYSDLRAALTQNAPSSAQSQAIAKAVPQIQQSTRQYAKRQLTWFRKEKEVHWQESFGDEEKVQSSASAILESQ